MGNKTRWLQLGMAALAVVPFLVVFTVTTWIFDGLWLSRHCWPALDWMLALPGVYGLLAGLLGPTLLTHAQAISRKALIGWCCTLLPIGLLCGIGLLNDLRYFAGAISHTPSTDRLFYGGLSEVFLLTYLLIYGVAFALSGFFCLRNFFTKKAISVPAPTS